MTLWTVTLLLLLRGNCCTTASQSRTLFFPLTRFGVASTTPTASRNSTVDYRSGKLAAFTAKHRTFQQSAIFFRLSPFFLLAPAKNKTWREHARWLPLVWCACVGKRSKLKTYCNSSKQKIKAFILVDPASYRT